MSSENCRSAVATKLIHFRPLFLLVFCNNKSWKMNWAGSNVTTPWGPNDNPYRDDATEQPLGRQRALKYWLAFIGVTIAIIVLAISVFYSANQDHIGAIPFNEDNKWYYDYEAGFAIQDNDVFFHGIGGSIQNAQRADIIFLGTSRPLLGVDWSLFEGFERKHQIKMFNMSFAGVPSGEFPCSTSENGI